MERSVMDVPSMERSVMDVPSMERSVMDVPSMTPLGWPLNFWLPKASVRVPLRTRRQHVLARLLTLHHHVLAR
jgi:hypothetical protein